MTVLFSGQESELLPNHIYKPFTHMIIKNSFKLPEAY